MKWYVREIAGEAEESEGEFPALERQKRYLRAGILRDDVSNYTLAAGILARNREGKPHRGDGRFFGGGRTGTDRSFLCGKVEFREMPGKSSLYCGKPVGFTRFYVEYGSGTAA